MNVGPGLHVERRYVGTSVEVDAELFTLQHILLIKWRSVFELPIETL